MGMIQRIRNLWRRGDVEAEAEAELLAHLEMSAEDAERAGMSQEDARRMARVKFGNPVTMRERTVAEDAALALEGMSRDVKLALRQLRKSPDFTVTAMVLLAR